jgi:Methyltransferase domain
MTADATCTRCQVSHPPPHTRYAGAGKWTCDLDYIVAGECTVFSLGSNGDATFEAAVLDRAQHCKVGCDR